MARSARDCVICLINAVVAIVSKRLPIQSMKMVRDCVLSVLMLARYVIAYMMTMIIGLLSVQTVLTGGIYGKRDRHIKRQPIGDTLSYVLLSVL